MSASIPFSILPSLKDGVTSTFDEAYEKNLKIMDMTAFTLCKENNMPVLVFDMNKEGNLLKAIQGEDVGTLVKNRKKEEQGGNLKLFE
jgi:uridylate kinase